eukprot:COSAG02_NODE_181_length_30783_cov_53.060520_24_plen_1137_part_00
MAGALAVAAAAAAPSLAPVDEIDLPPPVLAVPENLDEFKGMPDPGGTLARALVVIGHNPVMNVPEHQIQVRVRTIVDVVAYKPSPGGLGDASWYNSPESQWWTVRRDDGRVGKVPMTSLELIEEMQKDGELKPVAQVGTGYGSADSDKTKNASSQGETWVMPPNEWNVGCCGRIKKILGSLKYNEWSKWAQLFAFYVVLFEGLAVIVWDFNENNRLEDHCSVEGGTCEDNGTMPWDYGYCGYSTALLAAADGGAGADGGDAGGRRLQTDEFSTAQFVYCGHEVGSIHVLISLVTMGGYGGFIFIERSFFGAPDDATWAEKMKAPGPPKVLRFLVNVAVSVLLMFQPSPGRLAGCCTTAVALLSLGAVARGSADPSVMYTIEQNPVPLFSFLRSLCLKDNSSEDSKAAAADAVQQEKALTTMQQWKAHDRFSKIIFMMVYAAINAVLWLHWAYNAWVQVTIGSPHGTAEENSRPGCVYPDSDTPCLKPTRLSSLWIPIAKGCGQLLNFNCALIVIPVITELLHYLHDVKVKSARDVDHTSTHATSETTISKYVPLGKNITFHRYIAYMIAGNVFVHTLAHFLNYSIHPGETRSAYDITKLQFLPESLGVIRALEAWYTGVIIIVCMICMYSAAQESVKRGCFNSFWFSHHLFCVFWGCLLIHGPRFWYWSVVPLFAYFHGRIQRDRSQVDKVVLEEVVIEPPNVIKIVMRNQLDQATDTRTLWKYGSGMYLKLSCPFVSPFEWHPFTISSAPEGPWLTCHIKVTRPGSWTSNLKKFLSAFNPEGMKTHVFYTKDKSDMGIWRAPLNNIEMPMLKVDGPHSAPCQHISEFQHVILVGAGIGLTPFASTLMSLIDYRWIKKTPEFPQSCYLHWSFRMTEFSNFAWFVRLLAEVRARYISQMVKAQRDGSAFQATRLQIFLYDTSRPKDDEAKRKNATEIMGCATCVVPTADYDRYAERRVKAVRNYHPKDPMESAQLRFDAGDVIDLISSTRTSALLEKDPYLHGQLLVSPNNLQFLQKKGWFESEYVKECCVDHSDIDCKLCKMVRYASVAPRHELEMAEVQGKRGLDGFDQGVMKVRFGRPNWDIIFPQAKQDHAGSPIGVFCCGPMGKALRAACVKWSEVGPDGSDTIFKLHAEVF